MTYAQLAQRFEEAIGLQGPPLGVYYAPERPENALVPTKLDEGHCCFVAWLKAVRNGRPVSVDAEHVGCRGASVFLGFVDELVPGIDLFLSTGVPGQFEGERYKRTPELVHTLDFPLIAASDTYCIIQRLADIPAEAVVESVVFLEPPDRLGALFTLANFGRPGRDNVVCPFLSGCGAIVGEPRRLSRDGESKAVLGMFDITARPCVAPNQLSIAMPLALARAMADEIDESFLTLECWTKVRKRFGETAGDS